MRHTAISTAELPVHAASTFRFFLRAVSTVTGCAGAEPGAPSAPEAADALGASGGLLTAMDP